MKMAHREDGMRALSLPRGDLLDSGVNDAWKEAPAIVGRGIGERSRDPEHRVSLPRARLAIREEQDIRVVVEAL